MESLPSVKRNAHSLSDEQILQAVELINYSLGDSYTDFDSLRAYSDSADSRIFTLQHSRTGETIAVAIVQVYENLDQLLDTTPKDQRSRVASLIADGYNDDPVGLIKSMAVDPNFRSRGFGRRLTKMSLEQFREWEVKSAYAFGWSDYDGCHIQTTLESSGFEVLSHISDYYRQSSIDTGFNCPSCGNPCECSIKLFEQIL